MNLRTNIFLLLCLLSAINLAAQQVTWVSSTANALWKNQKNISLQSKNAHPTSIEIQLDAPQQTMEGFGGCFNELGWDALQILDETARTSVLKSLFDPVSGLNFTLCRTPIGANDYSRSWYSYNEIDGDFAMKNFSIDRDREALLPYIKSALAINPNIRLWASPWSAPTWFKTNHHYSNRSHQCNDLPKSREVPLYQDQMIQDPRYLQAYALYFTKYLNAYKAEGIPVEMVMYQNEAFTFAQWPNCSWNPTSIARFNTEYLGPELEKTHPDVQIYAGTFNTGDMKVFETIMNYPNIEKYVKGFAFQWEGRDAIGKFHQLYPQMKVMQSESECGNGAFGWKDAEHTFSLMKTYFDSGAGAYTEWNMTLADDGASAWCWKQNALVRIISATKEVIYTPEYYVYKHVCSQVPNGSVYLPIKGNNAMIAFLTPDKKIVLIAANSTDADQQASVKIGKKYLNVRLNQHSFNTFIIHHKK